MEDWINILGWLLSIITTIGNVLVVVLVTKKRRLHSSANWFVLSLAVADFCVGVVVFPSSYACNYTMCNSRVYMAFFWFFLHSSVANLCTLTWDRYIAIIYPLRYNTSMTVRRTRMVILGAWLIPFLISLSLLVGMYATESETGLKFLRIIGVSGFNILSCVLLFYAVARILVVARAQSHRASAVIKRQIQANPQTSTSSRRRSFKMQQNNKAAFIVALVVFFLGCYVVVNTLIFCNTFSRHLSETVFQVVSCLLVLNSAVNPLVYAVLKRDIKEEISLVICRGKANERDPQCGL